MSITAHLLPTTWLWLANALYAALVAAAVSRAPWQRLARNESLHVYLGTCVALLVLWTMKAGVSPGLSYHFLGATLLTLMFGWELALIAISVVLAVGGLYCGADWISFSANALAHGAAPIAFTHALLRLAQQRLPTHFFVYVFVNAFFGAALAVLTNTLVVAGVLAAAGTYTLDYLGSEYLAFAPLMMFGEAWITGMVVALLVCYRPAWITTFDDDKYLRGK